MTDKKNFFFVPNVATKRKMSYFCSGDMAEWSIAAVLKTVKPKGFGGSNPSVSARWCKPPTETIRRDAGVVDRGGLENR